MKWFKKLVTTPKGDYTYWHNGISSSIFKLAENKSLDIVGVVKGDITPESPMSLRVLENIAWGSPPTGAKTISLTITLGDLHDPLVGSLILEVLNSQRFISLLSGEVLFHNYVYASQGISSGIQIYLWVYDDAMGIRLKTNEGLFE